MLENTPNQPTKFRTETWVEINDNSCGKYNTNSQIKFKFNSSNFWRTFEVPLINCELNLILIWSEDILLLFENEGDRKVHTGYYLPKVGIKYYYVMIDGKNFLDQNIC